MLTAACGAYIVASALCATPEKGRPMSYAEVRDLLSRHTRIIELSDSRGGRVCICPHWQGRVMTSTCSGPDGPSFGFVNRRFIEAGKPDARLNNYGGEERMWLSPEGGQFSLWFKPGAKQTLDNWYTPPALNQGAWSVEESSARMCRMAAEMKLQNASATEFRLEVQRTVQMLSPAELEKLLGEQVGRLLAGGDVNMVAYQTVNRIINRGQPMTREKGLLSIWILGMFNAGPQTVVIIPYRPGDQSQLGPPVKSDYFGAVPAERLRVLPEVVLFRADGKYRSKIGVSQRRARNVLGSIDFESGVLTLVHFTMPPDPTQHLYMNNMWQLPQPEPYVGDVANSYNDGPNELGEQLGAFYEIESLSPAAELASGEHLEHTHRTLHVQAPHHTLDRLARTVLGVPLETVRRQMLAAESR